MLMRSSPARAGKAGTVTAAAAARAVEPSSRRVTAPRAAPCALQPRQCVTSDPPARAAAEQCIVRRRCGPGNTAVLGKSEVCRGISFIASTSFRGGGTCSR